MNKELLANEPSTLKMLFEDGLTLINEGISTGNESISPDKIDYIGSYTTKVIIYVKTEASSLSETETSMLSKTFAAFNMNIEDLAIIPFKTVNDKTLKANLELLKPTHVLFFGQASLSQKPLLHMPRQYEGYPILFNTELAALASDQTLKLVWWNAMKIFLAD
jgi:hypothetical protein